MNLVYLIVGWLLGLLGPVAFYYLQRRQTKIDLKKGILNECRTLKFRSALLAYKINHYLGYLGDELFKWLSPALDGSEAPEKDPKTMVAFHALAKLTVEERLKMRKDLMKENTGPRAVTYSLYILDSNLSNISLFSADHQKKVFCVKEHLDVFNQQVQFANAQFDKTWDPTISRDAVEKSLDESYQFLANRAKWIVEAIDDLESTWSDK